MQILNKVSMRSLKLNKKRTISTIIGIILSVALICAVAGLGTSFQATLVQNAINETGYWHIRLLNVKDSDVKELNNNRDIKEINTTQEIGYGILENGQNENKPYLKLVSMNQKTFEHLNFDLVEGRFPTNSNEIIISKHIISNGKVNYKIGNQITIEIGQRKSLDHFDLYSSNPYHEKEEKLENTQKLEFTIVGIIERPDNSFENYSDPGYTIITTNRNQGRKNLYISLKEPKEFKNSIAELIGVSSYEKRWEELENLKYQEFETNNELLRWEAFAFTDTTVNMLYTVCAVVIVIIIVTSVFCIRNSFAIATAEKVRMYGMLASIGATKKQIKKSVIFEAICLGIIGIPIGILCGILAVFVLVKLITLLIGNYLLEHVEGIVFQISIFPIVLSAILGFITVYLSALSSAKKASKITPIEGLRNAKEIKIKNKKLKTPKIISKLFKTGGVLAYKNLKRSQKKYRTTIISLAVSILIFITMNTFITNVFSMAGNYYEDYDYNIKIYMSDEEGIKEKINKILLLRDIEEYYILYENREHYIRIYDVNKINQNNIRDLQEDAYYDEEKQQYVSTGEGKVSNLQLLALDDETFKKYVKKVGANYETVKSSGILCDEYLEYEEETGKTKERRTYSYQENDTIIGKYQGEEIQIKVGAVTKIKPYGLEQTTYRGGCLVVNLEEYKNMDFTFDMLTIQSSNPDNLEQEIQKLDSNINVMNIEEDARREKGMILVINIFLYGFITVITLIGITNIFNTITSNMELRQKEFAMLKSIGMTKKEFNRMINLETIFYSSKALLYGIILGLLGTFALFKAFSIKIDSEMYIPIKPIIISIIAVFILVFVIMKYSIKKINKQNTIETIRKENI